MVSIESIKFTNFVVTWNAWQFVLHIWVYFEITKNVFHVTTKWKFYVGYFLTLKTKVGPLWS